MTATTALTAVPAFADPLTAANTQPVKMLDMATGASVTCNSSTATGTSSGGNPPFVMTGVTFSGCNSIGGLAVAVQPGNLPWVFSQIASSGGVIWGQLTGFKLQFMIAGLGCTVTVTGPGGGPGSIPGTFTSSSSVLDLGSSTNLVIVSTFGPCAGLFITGDIISLRAQYHVS
ncbi:hypothetical protein [Actinomadura monticuli]|uniref:Uncharacterized protein n=1 Tax=Actinomadura monticuli TaxID=3097367 RepID=A0ABV4QCK8_9ACTN